MSQTRDDEAFIGRMATERDIPRLARMNVQLQRDEGRRVRDTPEELERLIGKWIRSGTYAAAIFEWQQRPIGYVLFRHAVDYVELGQLFIEPEYRRRGFGRRAVQWLIDRINTHVQLIRITVRAEKILAEAFWLAMGFRDYSRTMQLKIGERIDREPPSSPFRDILARFKPALWPGEYIYNGIASVIEIEPAYAGIGLGLSGARDGTGILAIVTEALAEAGIRARLLGGRHQDHLFVPSAETERAPQCLEALREYKPKHANPALHHP